MDDTQLDHQPDLRPVLIQGAHYPEIEHIKNDLLQCREVIESRFKFWLGSFETGGVTIPVVLSETGIGSVLAAAATTVAYLRFNPVAIINQGIAGGHVASVDVGDIIVGEFCVNLNSFKTPFRAENEGSSTLDWKPKKNRGVGGGHEDIDDMSHIEKQKVYADQKMTDKCRRIAETTSSQYQVHFGGVGSSETWNSEIDRINYLHQIFGTLCEEMEAAGIAQLASLFLIPYISIRIVSNNIMINGKYEVGVAERCQRFVQLVCKKYYIEDVHERQICLSK